MSANPYESPKEPCPPAGNIQQKPTDSVVWLKIRVTLLVLGVFAGLIMPQEHLAELATLPPWVFAVFCAVGILFMPVAVLFVIGIQAINPLSDKSWERPTHRSNPLHLGNPLLFVHFAAYLGSVQGLGILASSLWNGIYAAALGLSMVFGGVSTLAGVRLAMVACRFKMVEEVKAE